MSATKADGSITWDQKPLPHGISGAQSPKASTIKRMVKIGSVKSSDIPQPHLPPRVPPPRYLPSSIRRYYPANKCPPVASIKWPANGNFWSVADGPVLGIGRGRWQSRLSSVAMDAASNGGGVSEQRSTKQSRAKRNATGRERQKMEMVADTRACRYLYDSLILVVEPNKIP